MSTHENEQTLKHSFRAAANATRQLEITRNQSKTSKNSGQVKQPTGVCNPTTATATATGTATTPPPLRKPLLFLDREAVARAARKGSNCWSRRRRQPHLNEWRRTTEHGTRTNRRKEQKRNGAKGLRRMHGDGDEDVNVRTS